MPEQLMRLIDQTFNSTCTFKHPLAGRGEFPLQIDMEINPLKLLMAYGHGIFPWYNKYEAVLWWFTYPRAVIMPETFNIPKSARRLLQNFNWEISYNTAFKDVMKSCMNQIRPGQNGTWIQPEMVEIYSQLHAMGWALSTEVRENNQLIGGLYGIIIGKVFFGESMFSKKSGASKFALIHTIKRLFDRGVILIDCQQDTLHMRQFGSFLLDKHKFFSIMKSNRMAERIQI